MKKFSDKLNSLLNKDVTTFLNKYKLPLIAITVMALLACIGMIVSYAFYQVVDKAPIIGGTTGEIADLDIRIMAEERDTNGIGLNSYSIYPYIPKAGYKYNSERSYCTNGSVINYNSANYNADITAYGHDVCYLYFDSTAVLDVTLNVYAENVDSSGEGTGEYTKLETTALPSIGYEFNSSKSSCKNGSTVSFNDKENMFTVEATQKDVCDAYMDAMDVDIALKIYVQNKKGSANYYETNTIPTNAFYTLASKSACTGSSTMSMKNQRVVIGATSRTNCVAYLDIGSGPILESMQNTVNGQAVTITLKNSNIGTSPTTYYYSSDNGATYVSSTSNTYTFSGLAPLTKYTFKAYSVDAAGNTSAIFTTTAETAYAYTGLFDYKNAVQTKTIEVSGYYKLQVWGAQGGSYSTTYVGGKGGYAEGTVHLNAGDTIYVYTGGQPTEYNSSASKNNTNAGGFNGGGAGRTYYYSSTYTYGLGGGGATDIRINADTLYNRIIVAGGGSGATNGTNGYAGGGSTSQGYSGYTASQTAAGTGGSFGTGGASSGSYNYKYGAPGGGGGWYGGGAGTGQNDSSSTYRQYSGGGSGFVYTGQTVTVPSGNTYQIGTGYKMTSTSNIAGNTAFTSPSGTSETGHSGNGYAKVTYIGDSAS